MFLKFFPFAGAVCVVGEKMERDRFLRRFLKLKMSSPSARKINLNGVYLEAMLPC